MAVEAWDEAGHAVLDVPGNLVCVKPFPAMPVCFWGDVGNEKYTAAYFGRYPNVWFHGDYVQFNSATGGLVMLGRSDGTLNPSVRVPARERDTLSASPAAHPSSPPSPAIIHV
jgi:acetoacetyl-CoA synthetase